jgi:hypothetical protein
MTKNISRSVFFVLALGSLSFGRFDQAIREPLEFGYPAGGEPWYSIHARMGTSPAAPEGTWAVTRVMVNGERARDFALLADGHTRPAPEVKASEAVDLKVRWSWTGKQSYEIRAELRNAKTGEAATLTQKSRAPAKRGYWNAAWKNYLSLVVSEDNGFGRTNYPVHATFGVLSSYLKSTDELRVVKAGLKENEVVYAEVPFQVYDVRVWNDPKILSIVEKDEKTGARVVRYHPTTSFNLAFLADLGPREKATYLVFYNNPAAKKPSFPTDLRLTGKGLGKTIENSYYKTVLHPKSGTIYEVVEKSTATKLEHKLETNGSVHWNPDVYSPPHAWYHCSDWENPPFNEDVGPVFYSLRREAPLPFPKGVQVSITYYFYAHSPAILAESVMEIQDDIFVMALRNAEIVFNKAVFNRAAWRGVDGKLQTLDFASSRMHPQHAATLRPDTPWVAFYSDDKGLGFASLFLGLSLPNRHGGSASQQQPYIYIQNGPWYYMSRGFVYSFGSNNQTRMLPVKAGSIYYDRNAWLPFAFRKEKGFAGMLDAASNNLKYPLGLEEAIETYAESPEGWVVPLLTEPFEEGVKGAIGGVKKK